MEYLEDVPLSVHLSAVDLVEEVRVIGLPRKVEPAGVVAGLAWPELQAHLERLKQ